MYCTNCGAQVSPNEKFCIKCGAPIIPEAVNAPGAGEDIKGFTPVQAMEPLPKKKAVWPIVVGIIAALAVVSVASVLLIRAAIKNFVAKAERKVEDGVESFTYEFGNGDEFGLDDFDDFDPYSFDFDEEFPEEFDFDEFFEEYGNTDNYSEEPAENSEYTEQEYEYADAFYYDDCVALEGRGVLKDSTVIYNGKTLGEFCDYIDSQILEEGRVIDRELLYDLLEVHLVDPGLITDNTSYFEQSMMYCLTFANEFGSLDMEVDECTYYLDEPTVYYYEVETYGKEDTWVVDYAEKTVYMNGGEQEYTSVGDYSMFSDDTLTIWMTAIDLFFGIE